MSASFAVNARLMARRLSVLSMTAGAESLSVGATAIAGFVIVHQLSKNSYGEYSFIASCVNFLVGLSDIGLSHTTLPIVGERNADLSWVVSVCRRVYRMRWRFFLPASLLVGVYWIHALRQHEWVSADFICASILAAVSVMATIREQACRALLVILRNVGTVNRLSVISSVVRLLLTVLAVQFLVDGFNLWGLMGATLASTMLVLYQLSKIPAISAFSKAKLPLDEESQVDKRITTLLRPLILPMFFAQVQGVITVFLVSLFSVTASIAEVGALTRPTLILAMIDRVAAILLFPAIARAPSGPALKRLIFRSFGIYFLVLIALLLSSIYLSNWWMLLIGPQYIPQQNLLWLAFLAAILMYSAGFAFTTLTSRGKTSNQVYLIPLVLAIQVIFVFFYGAATTERALVLSVVTGVAFFVFQFTLLGLQYLRPSSEGPWSL
jgi:hypothetical protein